MGTSPPPRPAPTRPPHPQELSVSMDRTLLLPVVVEHNVDEASPLFGHTLQSLEVRGQGG